MSLKRATKRTGRWSLATRLTIWYTGSAFVLLTVACALLYRVVVETIDIEDEQDLAAAVNDMQKILKEHPLNFAELQAAILYETSPLSFSPLFVRVLDRQGHTLSESPGMSSAVPTSAFPKQILVNLEGARPAVLSSPTGRKFHGLTTAVEKNYLVQVAVDEAGNIELLAAYRKRLALILGLGLVVCALAGHLIASRGIRPVEQIAATMQRIRSTTLNERIAAPNLPAELSALAATFNEMLDRLEDAFSRLSRFSADIAHELRTPINNLRGEAEVALNKPRSPDEYREVLASSLEECVRLSRLIDNLLLIARADNPQTKIHREAVNVSGELSKFREFYEASANEAGITLVLDAPVALTAELDATLFQRAVANLIENSLRHTPPGGTVTLRAFAGNGAVRVQVIDTGSGVAPEHLPHLFDRFYRMDSARSKQTGGTGLGLSIVKTIAGLHGGTVELQSQPDAGTVATLIFPLPHQVQL